MDLRAASMKSTLQTICRGHYYVIDVCKAIGDLLYYVLGQILMPLPLPACTMSPNPPIGLIDWTVWPVLLGLWAVAPGRRGAYGFMLSRGLSATSPQAEH